MEALNIVDLIEHNPITKLSQSYNGKLLTKLQQGFSNFEQQLFVSSFYCYLNYNSKTDFVVDLDNIWKWIGFGQKVNAKRVLEKHFTVNIDYKNLICQLAKQDSEEETKHGGHNKEIIMLTVKTFKLFCLKAGTKKADEIHEYYLKMEEIIQDTINEESNELKLQLTAKDTQIQNIQKTSEQEKQQLLEDTILLQFPKNTECVYIGSIDNTNSFNEKLIKFGQSNNLSTRVTNHKKDFTNFKLIGAFKVQNKVEIENDIKKHPKIKKQIRSLTINDKNYTELISIDEICSINKMNTYIKNIIELKICNIDNFNLLVKENEELKSANYLLEDTIKENKKSNDKLILKINELEEFIKKQNERILFLMEEEKYEKENPLLPKTELTQKFDKFVDEECIVRSDVEVNSSDIEAQFRIWMKIKPTKEVFHEFKSYLNIKFKPKRLNDQKKNQLVHGFQGIMLKPIEYKKVCIDSNPENFIFNVCNFAPNNRILNVTLLDEYKRWKTNLNKSSISDKDDMKEITNYLDGCPYVQKGALWVSEVNKVVTDSKSNYGYYGISLKCENPYIHKATSSTGKKVNKIETSSGTVLNTWDTIAKAASYEKISPAKMSRSISNNIKFDGNYHYITISNN
jgi:hypothetical protein